MDDLLLYLSVPKDAKNFVLIIIISFVASLFISFLYSYFYASRSTGSQVHRSFPLLGVSITTIFVAIQFSLALSLGLLGALSIVRFRTPIKEPEEIGFIMLIIASSICAATFNLLFLAALLVVVVIALFIQRELPFFGHQRNNGMVSISMPLKEYYKQSESVLKCLTTSSVKGSIDSITEYDQHATITYRFHRGSQVQMTNIQKELKTISSAISTQICFATAA